MLGDIEAVHGLARVEDFCQGKGGGHRGFKGEIENGKVFVLQGGHSTRKSALIRRKGLGMRFKMEGAGRSWYGDTVRNTVDIKKDSGRAVGFL